MGTGHTTRAGRSMWRRRLAVVATLVVLASGGSGRVTPGYGAVQFRILQTPPPRTDPHGMWGVTTRVATTATQPLRLKATSRGTPRVTFAQSIIPRSAAEIPNEMRGQFASVDPYPSNWPDSDLYYRGEIDWSQIEPSPGVYDFSIFDQGLEAAQAAHTRFGFRVMAFCPGCSTDPIPTWMPTEPNICRSWCGATNPPMPDWNDTTPTGFVTAYGKLMQALANHITPLVNGIGGVSMADDPRLGWLDMGGYGDWGEWHLSNQTGAPITHANMDTIMKSVVTAFPKVWTVAMTERARWLNDAVAMSPKVGLRVDCLGADFAQEGVHISDADKQVRTRWRTAPFISEWCGDASNPALGVSEVRNYHISMLSSGNAPRPPSDEAKFELANKLGGYRYRVDRVTVPSALVRGVPFTLSSKWENVNVAPAYEPWTTRFQLRNSSGSAVWSASSSLDLRHLMPTNGTPARIRDRFTIPSTVPAGSYTLTVRIVDPQHYLAPLRLADRGRTRHGAYPLGTITVR
jgi:hypothetical protein